MDYKKIILYFLIIVIAAALWIKSSNQDKTVQQKAERFASVYAGTAVMAELYRNEPDRFFRARDSIYAQYGVDSAWVYNLKDELSGEEEKWDPVWSSIKNKVDSLIEYHKDHPVTSVVKDSTAADSTDAE